MIEDTLRLFLRFRRKNIKLKTNSLLNETAVSERISAEYHNVNLEKLCKNRGC